MRKIKPAAWVAIFWGMLALLGLVVAPDYGQPIDEPTEQVILQQNIHEYAFQLFGAENPLVQDFDQRGITRISQSIERDHGQSAYYPAALIFPLTNGNPALRMALWHIYTWLLFMAGVLALYALARTLGLNRLLACATALLLYVSPRFFAEGHYNNKDVVLLVLVLCTFASGARFARKPDFFRGAVFSLAGALAANTKIVGVFAWGLAGLAALAVWWQNEGFRARLLWRTLAAIGAFGLLYAVLTPAMWADPLGYIAYVVRNATGFSRWTGVVLFKGALYDQTRGMPLPHRYLPTMVALTVPPGFLLLMGIGQFHALARCARKDPQWPLLVALTLLWAVPTAYVVIRQPLMYNGWRHFYFIYAGLAAMGGLGLQAVAHRTHRKRSLTAVASVAVAGMFLFQAMGLSTNHPYQYTYYNALAGSADMQYELDYWEVSTVNALRKLAATAQPTGGEAVDVGSRDEMSSLSLANGYQTLDSDIRQRVRISASADAQYLFENTLYASIYGLSAPEGYEKFFALSGYGRELCVVYRRIGGAVSP